MHTYTYSEKGYQIITHVRKYTCMLMLAFVLKCVNVYYLSVIISGLVFEEKFLWVLVLKFSLWIYTYENPKSIKRFLELLFNTNPEIGRCDKLYTVLYIHLIQWCTNKSSTLIILFVYLVCIPFPIHRLSHYLLMKYIQIRIVDFRNVSKACIGDLPF